MSRNKTEVLTAVQMLTLVFWVVTPCGLVWRYHSFSPEDGGSMFLRNVMSQPRWNGKTEPFIQQNVLLCYLIILLISQRIRHPRGIGSPLVFVGMYVPTSTTRLCNPKTNTDTCVIWSVAYIPILCWLRFSISEPDDGEIIRRKYNFPSLGLEEGHYAETRLR
jgi:hypothetical protein